MTDAPRTRKTHVIRIFGTNRRGEVLQDIWADVERIDRFKIVSSDDNYQGVEHRLRWMDDPNSDDYDPNGNPARVTELVKVCDPENTENLSDPDEWIPVYRIKQMKSTTTQGDNNYQGQQGRYKNDNLNSINEARIVERRRVEHYDTNIDDAAQAAANSDPSLKVFVVQGDQYQRYDDTRDETQYIEHEIPVYAKLRGASSSGASNMPRVDDQGKQIKLLNQYLIDQSEPAKLNVVGAGDIDPPYRLDVFQSIINVNFGEYANTAAFGDLSCYMGATRNGFDWTILGALSFGRAGEVENGEWLFEQKLFVFRGFFSEFETTEVHPVGMLSSDGFNWSNCDPGYGIGFNSNNKKKKKFKRIVNGYIYRIGGGSVQVSDVTGERTNGEFIERSKDISGDNDDEKTWEPIFQSEKYLGYGPLSVLKGDGPSDVPTIICAVILRDNIPSSGPDTDVWPHDSAGVIASTDGINWRLVTTTHFNISTLPVGKVKR